MQLQGIICISVSTKNIAFRVTAQFYEVITEEKSKPRETCSTAHFPVEQKGKDAKPEGG